MKNKKLLLIAALAVILVIAVLMLNGCGKGISKTIKLSDYVSVETAGISGSGHILKLNIDEEGLTDALGGKENIQNVYLKVMRNKDAKSLDGNNPFVVSTFSDLFTVSSDKTEELSNGDKITLTAKQVNPYNGVKTNELLYKYLNVEIKDAVITVEGLSVPYTPDMFKESHVQLFSEYMGEKVKSYDLYYGESVEKVHIFSIDYLEPKEGVNADSAFYISAIVTIRLNDGKTLDKDYRVLTKAIIYSSTGGFNINGEFKSNFQLSYLDNYNKTTLYSNPVN